MGDRGGRWVFGVQVRGQRGRGEEEDGERIDEGDIDVLRERERVSERAQRGFDSHVEPLEDLPAPRVVRALEGRHAAQCPTQFFGTGSRIAAPVRAALAERRFSELGRQADSLLALSFFGWPDGSGATRSAATRRRGKARGACVGKST